MGWPGRDTISKMEFVLTYSAVILLVAGALLGWCLTLVGLPGNWFMVFCAALYAWLGPGNGVLQMGWGTVVATALLAILGELAELAAGVWGARRAGGSRRAAVFALLGSLVGAVVGAALGVPIPVIGSLVAAVLGGAVGALAGAAFAEHSRGEALRTSWRVGHAAFWGRLQGTLVKTLAGTIIAVVLVAGLIV